MDSGVKPKVDMVFVMFNFSFMTHTLLSMNHSNKMKRSLMLLFNACQFLCVTSIMSYADVSVRVFNIYAYTILRLELAAF
jgi:hypothetical protein